MIDVFSYMLGKKSGGGGEVFEEEVIWENDTHITKPTTPLLLTDNGKYYDYYKVYFKNAPFIISEQPYIPAYGTSGTYAYYYVNPKSTVGSNKIYLLKDGNANVGFGNNQLITRICGLIKK